MPPIRFALAVSAGFALSLVGAVSIHAQNLTAAEARSIAREAYVYGYPMVENYRVLHRQAIAPGPFFRAPFNQISHETRPATPKDTQLMRPPVDTVLSYARLDLRAEPIVVTIPTVEADRYFSTQLVDLHTFNFGYLGTRATGETGGSFLIAGPRWQGEKPEGIREVMRCESQFAFALYRTQVRGADDLGRVREIQGGCQVRPLSTFLGQPVVAAEPPPAWLAPRKDMTDGVRLFPYLNFLLQFCEPHPEEAALSSRFARLGIGPGLVFRPASFPPEIIQAMHEGIADVWAKELPAVMQRFNRGEITAAECFGSREFFKGDFARCALGAKLGLYGNSQEEMLYPAYFSDREGRPFDASRHRYTLRFEKDQLPPSHAFWSLTLYDANTQLLVPNQLNRHAINSDIDTQLKYGPDGSLTLYLQKKSPGPDLEANWLPAPNGPFHALLRLYLPKSEAITRTWTAPPLVRNR